MADFTWPGFGADLAVSEQAARALAADCSGVRFGPVEMWQNPALRRPRLRPRRARPRVWLPWDGPPLREVIVTRRIHATPGDPNVESETTCETCGRHTYRLLGAERRESHWNPELEVLEVRLHPREPGGGLRLDRDAVGDAGLFGVREFPAWIFCEDRIRQRIEAAGFSNVAFVEAGELVSGG